MPMDRGTPDLVRHCVAAVAKEYGGDVNKAFAICVAQLQKAGYLKPDSMELTVAGKKKEAEHEAEPDAGKKLKAYEKLLKAARAEAREEPSYASDEDWTEFTSKGEVFVLHQSKNKGRYAVSAKHSWTDKGLTKQLDDKVKSAKSWDAAKKELGIEESYNDFDRLLNPRTRTGMEDAPRALARKYETVTKQESSMDFMRRLAGISSRYEDRAVQPVAEAVLTSKIRDKLVAQMKEFIDSISPIAKDSDDFDRRVNKSELFKSIVQKYGGEAASDIVDLAGKSKAEARMAEAADSHSAELHKHAAALIKAVKDGDVEAAAEALKGAFLVVDSEPHPEGAHPGDSLSSE